MLENQALLGENVAHHKHHHHHHNPGRSKDDLSHTEDSPPPPPPSRNAVADTLDSREKKEISKKDKHRRKSSHVDTWPAEKKKKHKTSIGAQPEGRRSLVPDEANVPGDVPITVAPKLRSSKMAKRGEMPLPVREEVG